MENRVSVMTILQSAQSLSTKHPPFLDLAFYWRHRTSAEVEHGTKCYLKPLKIRFVGQHCSLQVADTGDSYYGKGMRVWPYDLPYKGGWFGHSDDSVRLHIIARGIITVFHKQHFQKPGKYDQYTLHCTHSLPLVFTNNNLNSCILSARPLVNVFMIYKSCVCPHFSVTLK